MNDETVILAGNRKKAILMTLGSAVFVGLILFTGERSAMSFLGIAFFGLGFLVSLYTVLPGKVQLEIDRSGIEMKTLFKPIKLSWTDVDEFYIGYTRTAFSRTKMIGIKYSESYKRAAAGRKVSTALTGMEGALPDQFNKSAEEICELLNRYKREYGDSQKVIARSDKDTV